jgi:hypothetical protein
VALFKIMDGQRVLIKTAEITPTATSDTNAAVIRLELDDRPELDARYSVTVSSGGVVWVPSLDAVPVLQAEFLTEPGQCEGGIAMRLTGSEETSQTSFWQPIFDYLFNGSQAGPNLFVNDRPNDLTSVRISSGGKERRLPLRSITSPSTLVGAADFQRMILCLDPGSKPPTGDFSIEVKFIKPNPPLALSNPFSGEQVSGAGSPFIVDAAALPGVVGERALERNLDLGISYTTFRDPDSGTRMNRGVMDLRLLPILNFRPTPVPPFNQKGFPFWTPLYLDANIATGKITKETLSLNRIHIGSEAEYRYIPFDERAATTGPGAVATPETDTGHYTTFYRFILRANNASDRDYKQAEFTGSFEFQPVFCPAQPPARRKLEIWQRPDNR